MIIQENDFLKTYNEIDRLWEDALTEQPSVVANIKGQQYKFLTSFIPVEELPKEDFSRPGIYIWQRLPYDNNPAAYYVGQASNLYARTKQHVKAGDKDSAALHAAIQKYGPQAFVIAIIEFCSAEELNARECFWIKELRTFVDKHDYNLTPGGEGGHGPSKITLEMFEQIITQLQDTSDSALTFTEIGDHWGLDRTTIGDLNTGRFAYTREFIKELKLNIDFPIRSDEESNRIARNAMAKTYEKQYKTWRLILIQNDWKDATKTKIVKVASEDLGTYIGKINAWKKICEIERTRFNTPEEQLQSVQDTFKKGTNAAAYFEPLVFDPKKKYKRKYKVETIEE